MRDAIGIVIIDDGGGLGEGAPSGKRKRIGRVQDEGVRMERSGLSFQAFSARSELAGGYDGFGFLWQPKKMQQSMLSQRGRMRMHG